MGPCVKQTITATLVATNGHRFVATNFCLTPQKVCPRAGLETGVGYDLCKTICNQIAHAEINVVMKASVFAKGSTIYLEGHTYACETCKSFAIKYGVKEIIVGSPPK